MAVAVERGKCYEQRLARSGPAAQASTLPSVAPRAILKAWFVAQTLVGIAWAIPENSGFHSRHMMWPDAEPPEELWDVWRQRCRGERHGERLGNRA